MSAERVVQTAIYAALTGNAPYMALIPGGLFDDQAPPGTPTPYTVIGSVTEEVEAVQDKEGFNLTLTLHDFTGGENGPEGSRPGLLIREARNLVLHRALLTVAGFGLTRMSYDFGETLVEGPPDAPIWHHVTRYSLEALQS